MWWWSIITFSATRSGNALWVLLLPWDDLKEDIEGTREEALDPCEEENRELSSPDIRDAGMALISRALIDGVLASLLSSRLLDSPVSSKCT